MPRFAAHRHCNRDPAGSTGNRAQGSADPRVRRVCRLLLVGDPAAINFMRALQSVTRFHLIQKVVMRTE
jgi:hypothetical protein